MAVTLKLHSYLILNRLYSKRNFCNDIHIKPYEKKIIITILCNNNNLQFVVQHDLEFNSIYAAYK